MYDDEVTSLREPVWSGVLVLLSSNTGTGSSLHPSTTAVLIQTCGQRLDRSQPMLA